MTVALVAEYQNLNSGRRRMKGRNSSSSPPLEENPLRRPRIPPGDLASLPGSPGAPSSTSS